MSAIQDAAAAHRARRERLGMGLTKRWIQPTESVPHEPKPKPKPKPIELGSAPPNRKSTGIKWSFVVDVGEPLLKPVPSLWLIKSMVGEKYGVSILDMESARRTQDIVRPRQIATYLCATLTRRSLPAIGRAFGGRDHTTSLSSRNKIKRLMAASDTFKNEIELLKIKILAAVDE